MELRARYKERFEKTHGVGLGFMSLLREGLRSRRCSEFPASTPRSAATTIVYKHYVHLGVAVGTERGPGGAGRARRRPRCVRRDRERDRAARRRARATASSRSTTSSGGTFTISNGGVFGSLLSTPILNPPQSGILGMHKIEKRPVAVDDQVVIRPMMYLALSYDHRLVDGEQAVTFLVRVKERLEDPARLLLEV